MNDLKEEIVESSVPFVNIGTNATTTVVETLRQAKSEFPKSMKGLWILIPAIIFVIACI